MTQITTAPVRRYDQEQQRIPNFLRVNGQAPREVQTQMEQAERQRRYTGGQIGEEGAGPSAWRGRAASPMARANKVHDEESFTQFFQQAMQDAQNYTAQDQVRKDAIEVLGEANKLLVQTERCVKNAGKQLDRATKKQIKGDTNRLQKLVAKCRLDRVEAAQLEEIRAAKQQLENSAAEVIRMYDGQ